MAKRGRPLGWRKVKPTEPVVGEGSNRYQFPIVRDGNVRRQVLKLNVNASDWRDALIMAVRWALTYSEDKGATHWPLVRYKSSMPERRYVKRVDGYGAWTESASHGCWLSVAVLEAI